MFIDYLMVGIGGGIGAVLRALLTDLIKKKREGDFPLATFIINVTGSFLLGLILHYQSDHLWRIFLGSGILGGYTTFSTFHYETISLMKKGRKNISVFYYILSVAGGLFAAALGIML